MTTTEADLQPTFCVAQTATVERMEEIMVRFCGQNPGCGLGEIVADLRLMLCTEHLAPAASAKPVAPEGFALIPTELTPAMWKKVVKVDVWPLTPLSFKKLLATMAEAAPSVGEE